MAIVEKMAHNLWTHSPYASDMATPLAALGASEEPIDKMEQGEMSIGDRDGSEDLEGVCHLRTN